MITPSILLQLEEKLGSFGIASKFYSAVLLTDF
uniref:Uncharacterized protein n=1 Tax=Rhizophora mucronata TaxID=61149 RepID=A0A2P2N7V5_RHIMU